eukprot:7294523-Alexandrium_andersonii.AAC.1
MGGAAFSTARNARTSETPRLLCRALGALRLARRFRPLGLRGEISESRRFRAVENPVRPVG